ncbi:hypothetical protein GOP47_0030635, partial [Adiantum capillus-veneris]
MPNRGGQRPAESDSSSTPLPAARLEEIAADGVIDSWEYSRWIRSQGRLQRLDPISEAGPEFESAPSSPNEMSHADGDSFHGERNDPPRNDRMERWEAILESQAALVQQLVQVSLLNAQNAAADKGKGPASTSGAPASGSDGMGSFKPIKPTPYSGQRDSMILEKWIRDTESFYRTSKMEEHLWTSVVSHFLTEEAYSWFLLEERKNPYMSWTRLKAEMRDYFVPKNEDFRHLDEWRTITQGESKLQEYVSKYRQSMLKVEQMTWERVRLHGFLYGLKDWARREIEKQNPADYMAALAMAERLVDSDLRRKGATSSKSGGSGHAPFNSNKNQSSAGPQRSEPAGSLSNHPRLYGSFRNNAPSSYSGSSSSRNFSVNQPGGAPQRTLPWRANPSRPCRNCGGPHWDNDCHKASSQSRAHSAWANETNADRTGSSQVQITEITEQESESGNKESTEGTVRVGAIKASLHCLAARIKPIPNMYVKTVINGQSQLAMLDSGASHNFISPSCAKRLGVKTCKPGGGRSISVGFVQGEDSNTAMAYDVAVQVGEWRAKVDFIVVPMDSYDMMFGLAWYDSYVMGLYAKGMNQLMLDMNGKGVIVPIIRPMDAPPARKTTQEKAPPKPQPYLPPQARGQ